MKKVIILICMVVVICIACLYGYGEISANKTVATMALDTTNTVVTGIWDSDNVSKYNCLAIPDATTRVLKNSGWECLYEKITDIGEGAFQGNIWIESVYIPVNVIHIQKNAFNGCSSIKSVLYAGTEQQWKEIVIETGNDVLKEVSIEFNATMPRTHDFD